jgi:hypothetical protein
MPLLMWFIAHVAPAVLRHLLVRMVLYTMSRMRAEIAIRTADWRNRRGKRGALQSVYNDLRTFDAVIEWIERIVNLIIWLRARELCGLRAPPGLDLDFIDSNRRPTLRSLFQRMKNAKRRLFNMDASAMRMAAQWAREKHAATFPPLAGEEARRVDGGESQGDSLHESPLGSLSSRLRRTSPVFVGGRVRLCLAPRGAPPPPPPPGRHRANPRSGQTGGHDRGRATAAAQPEPGRSRLSCRRPRPAPPDRLPAPVPPLPRSGRRSPRFRPRSDPRHSRWSPRPAACRP